MSSSGRLLRRICPSWTSSPHELSGPRTRHRETQKPEPTKISIGSCDGQCFQAFRIGLLRAGRLWTSESPNNSQHLPIDGRILWPDLNFIDPRTQRRSTILMEVPWTNPPYR